MAYQQKDNTGALFTNKKQKEQKEGAPDYTGKAFVNGKEKFISAWVRKSESNETYMFIIFKDKDEKKDKPNKPF